MKKQYTESTFMSESPFSAIDPAQNRYCAKSTQELTSGVTVTSCNIIGTKGLKKGMRVLATDVKRAFLSPGFLIALAGTFLAGFLGVYDQMSAQLAGKSMMMVTGEVSASLAFSAMYSQLTLLLLPILCTLPHTHSFTEDVNSRFIRAFLPRAGRRPYLVSRAATTALSGGLAVVLGILLLLLFYTLLIPPEGKPLTVDPMIAATHINFLSRIPLLFVNTCIWALVGGIAAASMMNRYMAYAVPFILYYVLSSFQGRYFTGYYAANPQEWIYPEHLGFPAAYATALAVLAAAFLIYYFLMKRRLRDV